LKELKKILKLNSKNKFERVEGYCILSLIAGSLVLSLGIGLSILNSKGFSAILAMVGSLVAFLSTVALIFTWFIKDFKGE
jgi:hypothetical protein